ncbi:MAG: PspC domain-containing protein [Thermoanaerobaculia bacterium]
MPLHRSRKHRLIAGVCGGIAEWLGWSPLVVRILWIVIPPLGLVAYLVLWIVMPQEES